MSNVKATVQFSKSIASFTPAPLPIRDGNSPTIDMNFNGLNTVCKSNSERISALSDSIFKVNSVVGGLPLPANPTASIGLAAVNGTATTYMRSDAATALSQAIVPTWTGVHTFAAQPKINTLTASKPVFTDASKGLVSVTTIGVSDGGTGVGTFTPNSILYGNGTGAIQELTVQSTSTIFFLTQASSGVPDWRTLTASDMSPVTLAGDVTWAYTSALNTTIGANKVTYAKFQQVAASSLVGNATGSLANATGITIGSTLAFSASELRTVAMTGDVTTSANSFVTSIGANKVTLAMMAQVATGILLGRWTDGTGNVEALDASTSKTLLGLNLVENTALSTWAGSTNITTLGTIGTGTWSGTAIAIAKGGTGQTTAATSFNALSPLTTLGDILYGGTSGAGTRLAGNTTNVIQVLCQTGTGTVSAAPAWNAATGTGSVAFSASPTFTGTISGSKGLFISDFTLGATALAVGSPLTHNSGTGAMTFAPTTLEFQTSMTLRAANGASEYDLTFKGSRGSIASPSNVVNGDFVANIGCKMYSGGTFFDTAQIGMVVDGTFTSGQRPPSRIEFYTNAANTANALAFKIDHNQAVTFGGAILSGGTSSGYDEGTFTGTLVGCTTSPTDTLKYVRVGKLVTILFNGGLSGTSNSTQCSITGLPASLTPPGTGPIVSLPGVKDNGNTYNGAVSISAGGTITLFISTGTTLTTTGFTASGTKGVTAGTEFTFSLNT